MSIYYKLRNHFWLWCGYPLINTQNSIKCPVIQLTTIGYHISGSSRFRNGLHEHCPYSMDSKYWEILEA